MDPGSFVPIALRAPSWKDSSASSINTASDRQSETSFERSKSSVVEGVPQLEDINKRLLLPGKTSHKASGSVSSSSSGAASGNISDQAIRYGRSYLRDTSLPYPLPCDLPELHRQNMRTLLLLHVMGAPFSCPVLEKKEPKKILEIACGTALWTSACHDYLKGLGYADVSFTGLDIAHIAPDLSEQGINWRFVQHDLRKPPLPFSDEEFDLVFVKDVSMVVPTGGYWELLLEEYLRILKPGGCLELWETDNVFRTLLPKPAKPPDVAEDDRKQAEATATYTTFSGTAWAMAQCTYLQDYNGWVQKALEKRSLSPVPCTVVEPLLLQETENVKDIGSRRIALPLSEVRWERDRVGDISVSRPPSGNKSNKSKALHPPQDKREETNFRILTTDQADLRHTALLTVVQLIRSLEPFLKEASGKNQDEWDRWWSSAMTDLLEQNGTASGECLEIGAWWARRR